MQTKFLFNKTITGDETWCFACDPETKQQSSERVGKTSPWPKKTEIPKFPHQDHVDNVFRLSRRSAQRIRTRGKTVNAELYKGVMDRLLKRIQRVRPTAFCSRDSFCCTIMRPPTKLQVSANF